MVKLEKGSEVTALHDSPEGKRPSRRTQIVGGTDLTLKRISEVRSKVIRIRGALFGETPAEQGATEERAGQPGFFGKLEVFGNESTKMLKEVNEDLDHILEELE